MSQAARDKRYGRQGGHWLPDGQVPEPARLCEACGCPLHGAQQRVHIACAPTPEPAQPDLFA